MKKYTLKQPVEAVQWTGDNLDEVQAFLMSRRYFGSKVKTVRADPEGRLFIQMSGRGMHADVQPVGSAFVLINGTARILPKGDFESAFTESSTEPETYSVDLQDEPLSMKDTVILNIPSACGKTESILDRQSVKAEPAEPGSTTNIHIIGDHIDEDKAEQLIASKLPEAYKKDKLFLKQREKSLNELAAIGQEMGEYVDPNFFRSDINPLGQAYKFQNGCAMPKTESIDPLKLAADVTQGKRQPSDTPLRDKPVWEDKTDYSESEIDDAMALIRRMSR